MRWLRALGARTCGHVSDGQEVCCSVSNLFPHQGERSLSGQVEPTDMRERLFSMAFGPKVGFSQLGFAVRIYVIHHSAVSINGWPHTC
eukprot:2708203-Rhodomonas_salina.4